KTHDYGTNKSDYIESSLNPDFKFRDKKSGKEFYVEAKWRAGYYTRGNKIQWCNQNQLNRYKKLDKAEVPVFIALGMGDNPKYPDEIIIFPVSKCNYSELYDSYLDK